MSFNSLQYYCFLPVSAVLYHILPRSWRNHALLLLSFYFYMSWRPVYGLLIFASIVITYAAARLMEARPERKKLWVWLGGIAECSLLVYFKYVGFLADTVSEIASWFGASVPEMGFDILLPVGISFFTFQTLAYIIDVYRDETPAEKNFFTYALFVSFFPQLVAGPIERSGDLLPQLQQPRRPTWEELCRGMTWLLWGLFKKIVVADRLALMVNAAFAAPDEMGGFQLLTAAVAFILQVYGDFAGYSDIARGSALFFGIHLTENFRQPCFADSIKNYWTRWHLSLSNWLGDYVFYPLATNRKLSRSSRKLAKKLHWRRLGVTLPQYTALMATFLLSGLWHGASWHYVVWGGLHGSAQLLGDILSPARKKLEKKLHLSYDAQGYRIVRIVFIFFFIALLEVFFRASSCTAAVHILGRIFRLSTWRFTFTGFGLNTAELWAALASVVVLLVHDGFAEKGDVTAAILHSAVWVKWLVWLALVAVMLIFGCYGSAYNAQDFIYFQF